MTQPTAEAYEAALAASWYDGDSSPSIADVRAAVDAVWPLAVAQGRQQIDDELKKWASNERAAGVNAGRRLERERLAPLFEAAKALRHGWGDGGTNRLLAVFVAFDALTEED